MKFIMFCFIRRAFTKISSFTLILFFLPVVSLFATVPVVFIPSDATNLEEFAAKELRRLIYLRSAERLDIVSTDILPTTGDVFVVADQTDPTVSALESHTSGNGGFFIKSVMENGRNLLLISGVNGEATLAGVYRYAEKDVSEGGLGILFGLAEEVLPSDRIQQFSVATNIDEAAEPLFQIRGLNPWHDFPSGPDLWSTDDYLAIISQLPKLGMNFIGLHTYTRYNEFYHYENTTFDRGPEPTVWIGLPGDYDEEGQVSWSYPAYYAHSRRPNLIWGLDQYETGNYHGGTHELFPTDGWGSEVMGETPPAQGDSDLTASNAVFNRTGNMLKTAFTHAQNLGVKTALGTELTLGEETNDDGEKWIRGMPIELQNRLINDGRSPSDATVVKEVYTAIFDRIQKTHPLDYYWLWTWEVWPGRTNEARASMEADIAIAREALSDLGDPFKLGFAGWKLGAANDEPGNDADDEPTVFDDDFPLNAPFFSLLGSAIDFEKLQTGRVKWASTFLEYDAYLGMPELALTRIHEDAVAAKGKSTEGFIAKHWRTRLISPNVAAMKELMWSYGATGTDPNTWNKPTDLDAGEFIDSFYLKWSNRMFGSHANTVAIAELFINLESAFATGEIPKPLDWTDDSIDDIEGRTSLFDGGTSPAKIRRNSADWETEQTRYAFVGEFAGLRSAVTGIAELERFDYWLRAFEAWKLKGEYGCVLDDFETVMANLRAALTSGGDTSTLGQQALNLRKQLATLFDQIMSLESQKVFNVSDLGDIMNLEVVNWKQLMEAKHDNDLLTALGVNELPADANPGRTYSGDPVVQVTALRRQVGVDEPLTLTILAPGVSDIPELSYRALGSTETWTAATVQVVGRSVYTATIPAQTDDFEYKVEAGGVQFPDAGLQRNQVVVVSQGDTAAPSTPTLTANQTPTHTVLSGGLPQVGATLSVDPALILATNQHTTFTYQWMRNNNPITDATASNYRVTAEDQSNTLSVVINYTDLTGNLQAVLFTFPGEVQLAESAHVFYVSPTGNDLNDGSFSAPWRTLDGARQNVRAYLDGSGHIEVQFLTGHYPLASTVVFGPEDSGTPNQIVTYRAADGAYPVFSSLEALSMWSVDPNNSQISIAPLPEGISSVRFLYDSRRYWAERSATEEFTTAEAAEAPGQVENTTDILDRQDERSNFQYPSEFVFPDPSKITQYDLRQSIIGWQMEILPLASIDTQNRRVFTQIPGCYELREDTTEPRPAGLWILNSYEGLDTPGEWAVLDGNVYLYGRDLEASIYVPTLTELIRLDDGTNGKDEPVNTPVSHIHFEGLHFTGGDFYTMRDTRGSTLADRQKEITIQHDWAVVDKPTALLRLRNTEHIAVRDCTFTKSGGSGLRVDRYGQHIQIVGNEFSNLGRTGVSLIGRGPGYGNVNTGNVIVDNTFKATGREKWAAPALVLDQTTSNLIKHNAFLHTYFTAITVTGPRQMGILSKAEKLDAAVDTPEAAIDYLGREFHYYGFSPDFEAFLTSTEAYVLDPAKASLDAMQFVYNYDNYIEENLFQDVGDGANRFFNGKAAYLSGGTRDPDPAIVRKNYFRYNYIHDTGTQSYSDYAWYNDYDQDGAEMSGNIIANVISPELPLVLATSGYAEGGLGREPVSIRSNLVVGSSFNGTFVADGNDQGGDPGIQLQGNLVEGSGGDVASLLDYERMFAFTQQATVGGTPLPYNGSVRSILSRKISEFGGAVPITTEAGAFNRMVSFGDSLSDRGNNGIASDRDVTWVDALSVYLGLGRSMPSTQGGFNYAYGGAQTGSADDNSDPPSAAAQIQAFASTHSGFEPSDLITLWIGGNDFLANPESPLPAETLRSQYLDILQRLVDLGATNILWSLVPNYGLLPSYYGTENQAPATAYAESVNQAIHEVKETIEIQNDGIRIVTFDFPMLQAQLQESYAAYQLLDPPSVQTEDTEDSTVLEQAFLMPDGVHPTATGHQIIAANALQIMESSLATSLRPADLRIAVAQDPIDPDRRQFFLEASGEGRQLLQQSTDLLNWETIAPLDIANGVEQYFRKETETTIFYRLTSP
jgi:phospholipase/lecithinase/hemolysin